MIFKGSDKKKLLEKAAMSLFGNEFSVEGSNIMFRLTSKFRWGKYKGNELRDVYIFDPRYIQWCIANHNGFAVYEPDLRRLIHSRVFSDFDVQELPAIKSGNTVIVDLSSLNRDMDGFLTADNTYVFSHDPFDLVSLNKQKMADGINFDSFQNGLSSLNQGTSVIKTSPGEKITFKI